MLCVLRFELDGDLEIGFRVETLVYLPECSLIKFADDFVVLADFLWDLGHCDIYIKPLRMVENI